MLPIVTLIKKYAFFQAEFLNFLMLEICKWVALWVLYLLSLIYQPAIDYFPLTLSLIWVGERGRR